MIDLTAKRFNDDQAAREYLESIRWPNGPVCPHCGACERVMTLKGKTTRPGLYKCGDCRKQFSVTVGTVFERSKIPIHKWVLATTLLCSSKKGVSAHQLHRQLGITYKSAWFMAHRIREAMKDGGFTGPLGGMEGSTVEADETFIGRKRTRKGEDRGDWYKNKEKVLSLVERNGFVRSFHINEVNAKTLRPILKEQIHPNTFIMTDEAGYYRGTKKDFKGHLTVNHSIHEYVRGNIHTNTIEGYFSILKRGITGVYQHCSKAHLKRYLGEFDFRYNYRAKLGYDDEARTSQALRGIEGKRLTYNPINQKQEVSV